MKKSTTAARFTPTRQAFMQARRAFIGCAAVIYDGRAVAEKTLDGISFENNNLHEAIMWVESWLWGSEKRIGYCGQDNIISTGHGIDAPAGLWSGCR